MTILKTTHNKKEVMEVMEVMETIEVGQILKQVRLLRELKLQNVCDLAGGEFTPSQLSKIERGKSESSFRLICLIANALNISMDLLDGRITDLSEVTIKGDSSMIKARSIPLVKWQNVISHFLHPEKISQQEKRFIEVPNHIPPNSTAIRVVGEEMESFNGGFSFPPGSIVFVDSNRVANAGNYVIVKQQSGVIFRKLTFSENGQVLVPLNRQYATSKLMPDDIILGVVMSARINVEEYENI